MTPVRVNLRAFREEKKLSQQALGELAGVRQATISELESGKARRVDFKTLEKLATALGKTIGELLVLEPKRSRR